MTADNGYVWAVQHRLTKDVYISAQKSEADARRVVAECNAGGRDCCLLRAEVGPWVTVTDEASE